MCILLLAALFRPGQARPSASRRTRQSFTELFLPAPNPSLLASRLQDEQFPTILEETLLSNQQISKTGLFSPRSWRFDSTFKTTVNCFLKSNLSVVSIKNSFQFVQ